MPAATMERRGVDLGFVLKDGLSYQELDERVQTMHRTVLDYALSISPATHRKVQDKTWVYRLLLNRICDRGLPLQPVTDEDIDEIIAGIDTMPADVLCDFGKWIVKRGFFTKSGPDERWQLVMRKGYGDCDDC